MTIGTRIGIVVGIHPLFNIVASLLMGKIMET